MDNEQKKGRVIGIGGVFFKTPDADATRAWYQRHLGFNTDEYGASFEWRLASDVPGEDGKRKGVTQWSPFPHDTDYFSPSDKDFMFNYRVENIEALLTQLRADGIEIAGEMQQFDYGKFAWIIDLDGNKVELWEPAE